MTKADRGEFLTAHLLHRGKQYRSQINNASGYGGKVDAPDSNSGEHCSWGFNSLCPHFATFQLTVPLARQFDLR